MEIKKQYSYVVLTGLAINFHAAMQAPYIGALRRKFFNKQFMQQQFGTVHQAEIGEKIQMGGYPDTGSGVYSQKLSYKDWYAFNNAQRSHLNYLENLPIILTSLFAAGLYKPLHATAAGLTLLFSRILYCRFYVKGGAMNKFRRLGALGSFLAVLANLAIAGYYAYKSIAN